MYYRSVNRGAALTPAGRYTIGLILGLGLVAIGSGLNGVFLAFSLAISILITSGLLSEKIISSYSVSGGDTVNAEPDTPFALTLHAHNKSLERGLYGIENLVLSHFPKVGRWNLKVDPLAVVKVVSLSPNEERVVSGQCMGLGRGSYKDFVLLQRTLYPFGILSKFKFTPLKTEVNIPPKYDPTFAQEVREALLRFRTLSEADHEFHHHRPYTKMEAINQIDWKKSAGRPDTEWVVKVYESKKNDYGILIRPDWLALHTLRTSGAYEDFLARIRTAGDCLASTERLVACALSGEERGYLIGIEMMKSFLTHIPKWGEETTQIPLTPVPLPTGTYQVCEVGPKQFRWVRDALVVYE